MPVPPPLSFSLSSLRLCASVSLWFNSSALPNARHAIAQMRHREKKKFVRRGQACCRASCLPDTDTNRTPDGGAHKAEPRGRDGPDEAFCALQDRPSAQQAAPRTCLGTSTSVVGSPHLFARSARRRSRDRLRRVDESGSQAVTQTRPFAPASCMRIVLITTMLRKKPKRKSGRSVASDRVQGPDFALSVSRATSGACGDELLPRRILRPFRNELTAAVATFETSRSRRW